MHVTINRRQFRTLDWVGKAASPYTECCSGHDVAEYTRCITYQEALPYIRRQMPVDDKEDEAAYLITCTTGKFKRTNKMKIRCDNIQYWNENPYSHM